MKMTFSDVKRRAEFEKELKKLSKKYRTLEDDLNIFTNTQLILLHKQGQDNRGCVRIANLGISYPHVYKARKFACKSLKGTGSRSGIRVIYAYFDREDVIEFVEIYHKNEKANEDRERILRAYGGT